VTAPEVCAVVREPCRRLSRGSVDPPSLSVIFHSIPDFSLWPSRGRLHLALPLFLSFCTSCPRAGHPGFARLFVYSPPTNPVIRTPPSLSCVQLANAPHLAFPFPTSQEPGILFPHFFFSSDFWPPIPACDRDVRRPRPSLNPFFFQFTPHLHLDFFPSGWIRTKPLWPPSPRSSFSPGVGAFLWPKAAWLPVFQLVAPLPQYKWPRVIETFPLPPPQLQTLLFPLWGIPKAFLKKFGIPSSRARFRVTATNVVFLSPDI